MAVIIRNKAIKTVQQKKRQKQRMPPPWSAQHIISISAPIPLPNSNWHALVSKDDVPVYIATFLHYEGPYVRRSVGVPNTGWAGRRSTHPPGRGVAVNASG